jgi:hypothetical protein
MQRLKSIANEITSNPDLIHGATTVQKNKLLKMNLSPSDWLYIEILIKIFAPFYEATKCLSARKVSTLSMSYFIKNKLFQFLSACQNENMKEKAIKNVLLKNFKYHFDDKQSNEQKTITLVL